MAGAFLCTDPCKEVGRKGGARVAQRAEENSCTIAQTRAKELSRKGGARVAQRAGENSCTIAQTRAKE